MTGFIYIIHCGDWAKIGYSRDPVYRMKKVERYAPIKGEMVATFPATKTDEIRLHCHLWQHHLNWEWFTWCDKIAAIVANGLPDLSATSCDHTDCTRQTVRLHRGGKTNAWRAEKAAAKEVARLQVEWAS